MWIMVLQKISQKMHAVSGSMDGDLTTLNQVTKVLKIKYQKESTFLKLSQQVSFDLFIFSFWVLPGMEDLILFFPPISQLTRANNLVMFSLAVLLKFFQILDRWLPLLWCYIAKLAGKNSLINLLILRILTSLTLGLFFNHKFYCRLLAARFD